MVFHWAEVNPFIFLCPYSEHDLGFERMSYPSGYVSCFRIHGVPILPPILTDEERRQCQIYKQQAIEVEKRLQEKRLLKEKQLESVQEKSSQCEDENNSSTEMEVLEFIRKALGDVNDLEEVKLLISQVGEELKKRRSIGSRDSTFNDVDSISLNQSTDPCNVETVANYFDKQSDDVTHPDLQFVPKKFDLENLVSEENVSDHASATENHNIVSEPEGTVTSEFSRHANQLPFDEAASEFSRKDKQLHFDEVASEFLRNDKHLHFDEVTSELLRNDNQLRFDEVSSNFSGNAYPLPLEEVISEFPRNSNQLPLDEVPEISMTESSKFDLSTPYSEKVSPAKSSGSGAITPPRLIRSNSYTLDSPSPSVLMYLRSLALENTSEKVEVSSKVIKNLNNYWKDEEPRDSSTLSAVSELENGVENVETDNSDNEENSYNTLINNKVSLVKIPHEQNGYGSHLNNKASILKGPDVRNEIDEEKKAATIIQSAARGFLVRRLMKTQKIKDLKVIIKEAVLCAWNLYGEQAVSPADVQLHERIIQQVTAACYELHSIFFNWSTTERMALIRSDREKLKYPKPKFRPSRDRRASESNSVSSSTRSKSASSVSAMSRSSTPRPLHRPTTLPSTLKKNVGFQAWSR